MSSSAQGRARPSLRQGDVVAVDGQPWVILSRSCDLVRDAPEHALLAPVAPSDNAHALRGWLLRQVPVPHLDGHVADIGRAQSHDKTVLPEAPLGGCESAGGARRFANDVSRALGEASHPEAVNESVEPLWDELQHKRYRPGGSFFLLAHDILDVRVQTTPDLDPRDSVSSRDVVLIFIIEDRDLLDDADFLQAKRKADELGSSNHALATTRDAWAACEDLRERTRLLAIFCEQLGARCTPAGCVASLEIEVESSSSFTYARLMETDAIRVDRLSATPPAPGS